jgi:hypothetical protein
MNLKERYLNGETCEDFISGSGEHEALFRHHYEKADIREEDNLSDLGPGRLHILCLTEVWCGDSLAILPVVCRLAGMPGDVALRVIRRDDHPDLMDQYLTRGGRAIPIFIFLNEHFDPIGRFGPRPAGAQEIFEAHREKIVKGEIEKAAVHKMIRKFYARDRGRAIITEIRNLLKNTA